jgi:hypothetical protein
MTCRHAFAIHHYRSAAVSGPAALFMFLACLSASAQNIAAPEALRTRAPIEQTAASLAGKYAEQQMQRLNQLGDRDSLIAASLIGLPNDDTATPAKGHALVVQHLVEAFPTDPLALYTATLICQAQALPCAKSKFQARLLQVAPDNAVHYLLPANSGAPSAAQIKLAAAAAADSHFIALLAIVRKALANQPAPAGSELLADGKQLALLLRQIEVGSVPWPKIGPTTQTCSVKLATHPEADPSLHGNCLAVALALFSDQGQSLVVRSFGGSLVRRFAPGTQAAVEAAAFRRQYVWLSEAPEAGTSAEREQIQIDQIQYGEWEALQRHAERAGVKRDPPANWVPKNPELLLLPEERS